MSSGQSKSASVVKREQEAAKKRMYREQYAEKRRAVRALKQSTDALLRKADKLLGKVEP